ncbi:MAG TPA: peptidoglycan DD-metalloendopeptidase family protein [Thermoleophilaceae bacterium]|jgi:peptidoglycan hydrolase-like protein with peptidoglycan-binding domain
MPPLRTAFAAAALAALALIAAPAAPAAASSANTAALQVALRALHHYHGSIDGIRGSGTTRAVRVFQKAHRLPVDGIVGPRTRRALGRRGAPGFGHRTMRRGQRGWDVAALQFLLQRRGFSPGSIDGGFGSGTDGALRRFQRSAGLGADSRAGPATLRALVHGRSKSSGSTSSGATHGTSHGSPSGPVRFLRPVNAPITSPFGMRWGRPHQGIDFGAPAGAAIHAAGVGTVVSAGWNSGGYGNLVIVQHRLGFQTYYAHQSRIAVRAGQSVNGGSLIGFVGSTGHATGAHLHFEVRRSGTPIDPVPYLLSRFAKIAGAPAESTPQSLGCALEAANIDSGPC